MKYGIAFFPSKKIQDEANSYRMRYDPHYDLIPPHITLKEAFQVDEEKIGDLVAELKKIANETKPFNVNMNKVSTFAPTTNTIYLKVEPVPEIIELNEKMQTGKFPVNKEYSFVPHITIAQKLKHDEYSDIYGSMQMKNIELEDTIDRFQLLYQLDNGMWTVYESFVFGKEVL